MSRLLKNKSLRWILVILIGAGLVFILGNSKKTTENPQADAQFLRAQMKVCTQMTQSDNCYKKAADTFLNKWDYIKILGLLKDNEQYPEVFSRCHELTHYLGRQAYEIEKSVPKVYANASQVCWGGFYHGVMEAYFFDKHLSLTNPDSPAIAEALNTACGAQTDYTAPRFYSECVHGIGHAMMFITNTDLNKSLAFCDKLGPTDITACYGGVFMENSSSSTNTAHPTQFLNASDPMYPCDSLDEKYLKICYQYQSSYFAELSHYDWQKNAKLCQQVPAAYQTGCFHIIGTNQVGSSQSYETMQKNCKLMPSAIEMNICFTGVIDGLTGRYVDDVAKSADFCAILDESSKEICYKEIGKNVRGWSSDPEKVRRDCESLKQEEYINWCLAGTSNNSSSQSFN